MKSSIKAVRDAFRLAIESLGYQVYDREPRANFYPYVLIGEQSEKQTGDQGAFGCESLITMDIIKGWKTDFESRGTGDDISDAILQKILNKPHTMSISGFAMPVLVLDNLYTFTEKKEAITLQHTVMRFRMELF